MKPQVVKNYVPVKEVTDEQIEEITKVMIEQNKVSFNSNKALEELAEFQEAFVKFQTKHKDNPKRPTPEDIIGEFADLMYRGMIGIVSVTGIKKEDLADMIDAHIQKKFTALYNWYKSGKYKNGL